MKDSKKISVLICDDSMLFSKLLTEMINSSEQFKVCGCANDVYSGRDIIESDLPDMMILDVEMPKMNGISFLRQLIPQYPIPVIVCSSKISAAKEAMKMGAVDFISKPDDTSYDIFKEKLLKAMNSALNIRRICCDGKFYNLKNLTEFAENPTAHQKLIAIGGSAGSTEALPVILKSFNSSTPPIAVTLHMPEGYTKLYAQRLNIETNLKVVEASQGLYIKNGMAVIAQGNKHMRIFKDAKGYFVSVDSGPKVSGHCPSVDVLFESCAYAAGKDAIGVILTGMGSDGAKGMKLMKNAGAYTIGQDEKSCMVYGMPKAAFNAGAVDKQCSLENIAYEVYLKLNNRGKA